MTSVPSTAQDIAHQVLARVFGSDAVREPRADTPLSAYGNVDIAWVMVAAAVEQATAGRVVLGDDDVAEVETVGGLVEAISAGLVDRASWVDTAEVGGAA
jgi:hypothetical protein